MRNLIIAIVIACCSNGFAETEPPVSAASAIIMDAQTGKIFWSKDAEKERFPASTTKIMTALLLLEHSKPNEIIKAPSVEMVVDGASLHVKPNEQFTAVNLLKAILLRSANDACELAANHVSGSIPNFVKLMNQRALELGCTNTNFDNPHGLPDAKHTTSAHDLALIAREVLRRPEIREIVKNRKLTIERSINQQDCVMLSHNRWLDLDPTADGLKTGFTKDAGHCYVGSATRKGYRLITVILNSPNWCEDQKALLDWGFARYDRSVGAKAGVFEARVPIAGANQTQVRGRLKESIIFFERPDFPKPEVIVEPNQGLAAPLKKGDIIGYAVYRDADGWEQRQPLVTTEALTAPFGSSGQNLGSVIFGGVLGAGAYIMRRKVRTIVPNAQRVEN